jgi:hypothetical protein
MKLNRGHVLDMWTAHLPEVARDRIRRGTHSWWRSSECRGKERVELRRFRSWGKTAARVLNRHVMRAWLECEGK